MSEKLVIIKTFGSPIDANIDKFRLIEAGIQAFLNNEFAPLWLGPFGTGDFSVQLQVRESDVELAMKVLNGESMEEPPQDNENLNSKDQEK